MARPATIQRRLSVLILILLLVAWTVFIVLVPPAEIVERLGLENGYAVVFLLAVFSGLSTFIPLPYYLVVATFGAGGLNPVLLGLAAGSGVILGDSASYLIGYHSRAILPTRLQRIFEKVSSWSAGGRPWLVPATLFLYGAAVPFPNDLIVIPLGLVRYSYWRLIIPLGLGNIVSNIGVAFLGTYGIDRLLDAVPVL